MRLIFKKEGFLKGQSDEWGFATVVNGLSNPHKDYLRAGDYGFIIGDRGPTYLTSLRRT